MTLTPLDRLTLLGLSAALEACAGHLKGSGAPPKLKTLEGFARLLNAHADVLENGVVPTPSPGGPMTDSIHPPLVLTPANAKPFLFDLCSDALAAALRFDCGHVRTCGYDIQPYGEAEGFYVLVSDGETRERLGFLAEDSEAAAVASEGDLPDHIRFTEDGQPGDPE